MGAGLRARGGLLPASLAGRVLVGAVALILLGALAVLLGRELFSPDSPRPARGPAQGLVRFTDPTSGISIAHPAAWRRVASGDPGVVLLAEGEGSSMLVRTADLGLTIGLENLGPAKKLTDRLVRATGKPKLLRPPSQVTLGGLPGYLYLYTFTDAATGRQGAHAHYFLFRGQTLITVIFQTVPAERLTELAPHFDRIGETLEVTPR